MCKIFFPMSNLSLFKVNTLDFWFLIFTVSVYLRFLPFH